LKTKIFPATNVSITVQKTCVFGSFSGCSEQTSDLRFCFLKENLT